MKVAAVELTFDANGNTTTKVDSTGTTNYSWDYENRLTSVTLPGSGGSVSYRYDPMGRRIYKSSSSGTSIYAYDFDTLVEETNSSGAAIARYTQSGLIDEPLAMLRSGVTSYYQADGLGSVTSLSNAAGALAQTYTFDSFGSQTASSGSLTNPFRYTALEFDTETNLQFSRARYYDPSTGRFISEDPIRFGGGISFYPYVGNQPTNFSDPSGLNRQQIGPPTKKYNCLAWGLGLNWVWVQPADGTSPNSIMPQFGCKKIDCNKDVNCQARSKVKVFEDSGDPHNWHVERQTCDKGWTSKYGQGPLFDHIDDPDADYADVYKPKGKTKATCWSCPVVPPTALPKSPDIQYIQQ